MDPIEKEMFFLKHEKSLLRRPRRARTVQQIEKNQVEALQEPPLGINEKIMGANGGQNPKKPKKTQVFIRTCFFILLFVDGF